MDEIPGTTGKAGYGVCLEGVGSKGEFDYLAGADVEADIRPPQGFGRIDIVPQTYAVFTHRVTADAGLHEVLQAGCRYIWGTWLPSSEFEAVEEPDFERYDERFDPFTPAGEFDICLPVRAKA
jgi:AraC family transcriptional regulator